MYRIGELAKVVEATSDTIRYYEKQQMMEHRVRTKGGFHLYTEDDFQRPGFICHARQLGFSLESIRELLSIRIGPEHHTCQGSKGIIQERLQEAETRTVELQSMQRSLQRLNDTRCGTVHSSACCSILEVFEQEANDARSGCRPFALAGLYSRH